MKVKICGITNLQDALLATEAGADFLGFILYPPSKRSVDIKTVVTIAAHLRQRDDCPALVGVFVNETAVYMANMLDQAGLDLAQLSGEEVPALIGDSASPIYGRCYKALRPSTLAEAEADAEWYVPPPQAGIGDQGSAGPQSPVSGPRFPSLLIDTHHPTLRGGTGEVGDWALSARLAQAVPGLMLAGGLTAVNVAEAVCQVRPFAVDVASGVEAAPGKKDPEKVRAFIRHAKQADLQYRQ